MAKSFVLTNWNLIWISVSITFIWPGYEICNTKSCMQMKKETVDSEKVVERKLVELVKINGGMCIKLLCDQLIGLPDRMCLFPGHKIVFVELKTTGRKPKRIQAYMHNKLRALGFRVEVIDTIKGVEQFIDSIIYGN